MKDNDTRETPPELFLELNRRFEFDLDACANHENALCPNYFTEAGMYGRSEHDPRPLLLAAGVDGLTGSWKGRRVFCNFPYSEPALWLNKAWESKADLVYCLAPACRTEQPWWAEYVEPFRDGKSDGWVENYSGLTLTTEFLKTRRHFLIDGKPILRKNKDGSLWLHPDTKQPTRSSPKFGLVGLLFTPTKGNS